MQRIDPGPVAPAPARRQHHQAQWAALARDLQAAQTHGACAHRKWPVAQRLDALLDAQAPFLALSGLAGAMCDRTPTGGGIVTGIGRVRGTTCMVIANDWQHKGGTYQPATLQKHLRAQAIAERLRLPCVYLVDSGGIFLPRQAELFAGEQHFGRMFANQARMSASGIAQIAVVLGMCTAGGAYVPAMADENIIVRGQGTIFLAGPALVRAATGEQVDAETLGGADVHARVSGVADHIADDEAQAFALCRDAVAALGPRTARHDGAAFADATRPARAPRLAIDDLADVLPIDLREPFPMRHVIARLVDDSAWHPFKETYGAALLCGSAYLAGQPIGIVANDGLLDAAAAQKAAHFIGLCDQREVPLLFLQHTTGFEVGRQAEAGGIAKEGAKMVQAVSCARVPKLTLIVGASHGAGNYAMCGRGMGPDFLFAWPNSRVSVMGPEQAADTLLDIRARAARKQGKALSEQALAADSEPLRLRYAQEASALYATSALWDDGIIAPADTRRVLSLALAACHGQAKRSIAYPVVRQ